MPRPPSASTRSGHSMAAPMARAGTEPSGAPAASEVLQALGLGDPPRSVVAALQYPSAVHERRHERAVLAVEAADVVDEADHLIDGRPTGVAGGLDDAAHRAERREANVVDVL